jgi:hypothetical protein
MNWVEKALGYGMEYGIWHMAYGIAIYDTPFMLGVGLRYLVMVIVMGRLKGGLEKRRWGYTLYVHSYWKQTGYGMDGKWCL